MTDSPAKILIFYDGHCLLCRRFKARYAAYTPGTEFEWVDVASHPERFTALGYSAAEALKSIHAWDAQGNRMHVGIDVILLIWRSCWWMRPLAFLIRLPLMRPLAAIIYRHIASKRRRDRPY